MTIRVKVLLQEENQLKLNFNNSCYHDTPHAETSNKYLCGAVYFQLETVQRKTSLNRESVNNIIIKVRFCNLLKDDNIVYRCNFSSKEFNQHNVSFPTGEEWHYVFQYSHDLTQYYSVNYSFDVAIQLEVVNTTSTFASLYEDTELTDFELCAEDGSLSVHSLVLAGVSPYFKTMLTGEWKETSERRVTMSGTKETLEQFKSYIYLNKLPETDTQHFLLLGIYYMMPELVIRCSTKLLSTLNAENFVNILEFVLKNKLTNLLQGILNMVKSGMVSIEEVSLDNCVPNNNQISK